MARPGKPDRAFRLPIIQVYHETPLVDNVGSGLAIEFECRESPLINEIYQHVEGKIRSSINAARRVKLDDGQRVPRYFYWNSTYCVLNELARSNTEFRGYVYWPRLGPVAVGVMYFDLQSSTVLKELINGALNELEREPVCTKWLVVSCHRKLEEVEWGDHLLGIKFNNNVPDSTSANAFAVVNFRVEGGVPKMTFKALYVNGGDRVVMYKSMKQ